MAGVLQPYQIREIRVYSKKADGDFEAHLVALSCSQPPEGFVRWTLGLLADKVVELDYIDSVSHETAGSGSGPDDKPCNMLYPQEH